MTTHDEEPTVFEKRARALLEKGVARVDGRVRSRLNRARHAALAQLEQPQLAFWRTRTFVPASLAAAVVAAVALVAWQHPPHSAIGEGGQSSFEDLDLLADGEAFDLMQDNDGAFYEWAASESEAAEGSSG
jgi:hypothetical protein